jgi:hypothetical protein
MTEYYKRELVANPYLFFESRPVTRQLLDLISTSIELLKWEMEKSFNLCFPHSYPPLSYL